MLKILKAKDKLRKLYFAASHLFLPGYPIRTQRRILRNNLSGSGKTVVYKHRCAVKTCFVSKFCSSYFHMAEAGHDMLVEFLFELIQHIGLFEDAAA